MLSLLKSFPHSFVCWSIHYWNGCYEHFRTLWPLLNLFRPLYADPGLLKYSYTRFGSSTSYIQPTDAESNTFDPDNTQIRNPAFLEFNLQGVQAPPVHLFASDPNVAQSSHSNSSPGDGGNIEREFAADETSRLQTRYAPLNPIGVDLLCTLIDTLERLGHWRIAKRFAGILRRLSQLELDDAWMFA